MTQTVQAGLTFLLGVAVVLATRSGSLGNAVDAVLAYIAARSAASLEFWRQGRAAYHRTLNLPSHTLRLGKMRLDQENKLLGVEDDY